MAQVASNPTRIVRVRPYYQNQHLQFIKTSYRSQVPQQNRMREFRGVACQSNTDSSESPVIERPPDESTNGSSQKSEPSPDFGLPEYQTKDLNRRIALGAFGLFLSGRLDFSLKDISAAVLPYEEKSIFLVSFRNQRNLFGVGIGVEGIPHFAFLDKEGNEEANVIGRLPMNYFLENVDALARGEPSIPNARVVGQYTSAESRKVH